MKSVKRSSVGSPLDARLAAYAVAAVAVAAPALASSARAAIVFSGPVSLSVPNTFAGIYLNFVTGGTGISGSSVAGYDFNPYSSSGSLAFFFPTGAGGVTNGGVFSNLPGGALISSALTFTGSANNSAAALAAYRVTGGPYLGVEFLNESTGIINYGYVHFATTETTGYPALIVDYAYENTGGPITVGGPVPEPTTNAALGLGALALGAVAVRRLRKNKPAVA